MDLAIIRVIMASATKEIKMDSKFSPTTGTSKRRQGMSADASPDSKCPICLDRYDNLSFLDRCLHRFCFRCIQEWSKNKAECPLCKQPFHSIFHSVRAEDDFKEYVLRSRENGSFASPDGQRFRYRTTLTRERRSLLQPRRTVSPPDNGVIFEGMSGHHRVPQPDGGIHRMILRLASRRRAQAEGRSMHQIQEQEMINFRRALYRSGVRVRNVQDGGRYRDVSAEFFRRNSACLHRLVPWLKRELTVLFGVHGSLVNIVQHIIMSNVTRYNMESQAFADDLKPFLLHRTDHFLHEFISFARSPFNMEAYDQHASYDCPAPSYEEESHSDSSVITISPDEGDTQEQELQTSVAGTDQAPWDDETPGPSYSSTDQVQPLSSSSDTSDNSDEEPTQPTSSSNPVVSVKTDPGTNEDINASEEDDCIIVGYVKPLAERTPELVQLSSDSEESTTQDADTEKLVHSECAQLNSSSSSTSSVPSSPASQDRHKCSIAYSHKDKGSRHKEDRHKGASDSSERARTRCASRSRDKSRRKARSRSTDSISVSSRCRERYGHKRRYHSKRHSKDRSVSKDSSRRGDNRSKWRSRSRDRSSCRRSRTVSINSSSTVSRDRGRSRSLSRDYDRVRSRSRDMVYSYSRECARNTGYSYQWDHYSYHTRNKDRDSVDSLYRDKTYSRSYLRRHSPSPDYRIHTRSQNRHEEDGYYHHRRHRSRSLSSSRSRISFMEADRARCEKPSGKRKYKTRHIEHLHKDGIVNSHTCSLSRGEENAIHRSPLRYSSFYKNSDDFSENRASSEKKRKKRRNKSRSPSVEIVYEGKTTDKARRHKKKKKKHKKKHRKHRVREQTEPASPPVITIDSDSDNPSEGKFECDSSSIKDIMTAPEILNERATPESLSLEITNQNVHIGLANLPSNSGQYCGNSSTEYLNAASMRMDSGVQHISKEEEDLASLGLGDAPDSSSTHDNVENESEHQDLASLAVSRTPDSSNRDENTENELGDRGNIPPVSPRTTCSERFAGRPRLIIKVPKRLLDSTHLFRNSDKST
ncbi:E3 ubiquitin-protein ligase Topors isoform X2 [Latimeria chalumnae]|uniref:E3 ubiquitin-protein ligase Topors n=2 Tax=Latimeria chalumnae TaxID=7897 RepID=H3A335_LATCH|nr:PREDICTED: E3 ubiquitin-protein ligase Topors isoform X2 [Latimeria chalumnae]|eukprot:XP_006009600.1 PREDICTED: E3 ubiquitin-protein ligase Topors isoform X2 [Latimeria chalumnae]